MQPESPLPGPPYFGMPLPQLGRDLVGVYDQGRTNGPLPLTVVQYWDAPVWGQFMAEHVVACHEHTERVAAAGQVEHMDCQFKGGSYPGGTEYTHVHIMFYQDGHVGAERIRPSKWVSYKPINYHDGPIRGTEPQ